MKTKSWYSQVCESISQESAMRVTAAALIVAFAGFVPAALAQQIHTVNANGPSATPPWDSAVPTLTQALALAVAGDEVWVAAGTYITSTTDPRASFVIPPGIKVRGGFTGTEVRPEQRNPNLAANATVLTGRGPLGTNAVVRVSNAVAGTLIDRVTITGGYPALTAVVGSGANGASGLLIVGGLLEIVDSTIADNSGNYASQSGSPYFVASPASGAGVGIDNASVTLRRCRVLGNIATSPSSGNCVSGSLAGPQGVGGHGGGVFVRNSLVHFEDCTISGNRSGAGGSGIRCATGNASRGTHAGHGGGIFALQSTLTMTRCTITSNSAGSGGSGASTSLIGDGYQPGGNGGSGGGIALDGGTLTLDSCIVMDNVAGSAGFGPPTAFAGLGGGIYATLGAQVFLYQSVLARNRSGAGTGGWVSLSCSANGGNAGEGGALALVGSSSLRVVASTIAGNRSGAFGPARQPLSQCNLGSPCCDPAVDGSFGTGAIASLAGGPIEIIGSIIWDHADAFMPPSSSASFSCIQGGASGSGNIDTDPLFMNPAAGDYRLQASSPAIDAGSNGGFMANLPGVWKDADGRSRFVATRGAAFTIDMGPFEFPGACLSDFNASGSVDAADIFAFLNAWFAGEARADVDASGTVTQSDLFSFINAWFAGCA